MACGPTEMAKSVDICCPECGRLYHADESHLGKSIRCVQCGRIFLLVVGGPAASEQGRSAVPGVQSCPQSRGSQSKSFQNTASVARAGSTSSFGWVVRGFNKPQNYVVALATFAFVMTALRPPFVFGRRIRYGWLWSHSGPRIELTRLLVEWTLIVVVGAVAFLFLRDGGDFTPILAIRLWWKKRSFTMAGTAATHQANTPLAKHPRRRIWRFYSFAIATIVILVAAILLLRLKHDTSQMSDIKEPTQSQLNQQREDVAREPIVNQEPQSSPTREAVADADTSAQPLDSRPKSYNSPPTGTRCEEEISTSGHGELTVKNGTSEDAQVLLSDAGTDQIVRCFFVRAHTSTHMEQIPVGTDRLAFTTGLNWVESGKAFSWHPSYSEFERAFAYTEQRDSEGVQYHSIDVTLHTVPFGNVKTRAISREEFLRGRRHISLQRP